MPWTKLLQEILSHFSRGGNTEEEEERLRRIFRDVMSETSNSSGPEKEILERMLKLMEHNAARHTSELQATAQERDNYRTKLDEVNRQMEQLMRDGGARPSGGEDPGLTQSQKRLAEMWEELKSMRQNKQSDETPQRRPFNKGGRRGGSGASDGKPRYQPEYQGASDRFGRQNKDGTPFSAAQHYSQGRDSEKCETSYYEGYEPGSFPSKPFHQHNMPQECPLPFSERLFQHGGRDRRHDFGPQFHNIHDDYGFSSNKRDKQGYDGGPKFFNRDAAQNVGMQNYGLQGGSYQHRGQSHNRGQHHQSCGQFHEHHEQLQAGQGQSNQNLGTHGGSYQHRGQSYNRGQHHQPHVQFQQHQQSQDGQGQSNQNLGPHGVSYQHRGQSYNRGQHQPRGQFRQRCEQSQDGQGQRHRQVGGGPEFSNNSAVQNVGMQNSGPHRGSYPHRGQFHIRGQHHQPRGQSHKHREQSQDGQGQSHFTREEIEALRSVLKQRVAAAERTELPDDSVSDVEDPLKSSNEGKPTSDSKKKKKKKVSKNKTSKDPAAAEQTALDIFTASGFDMSQMSDLNMDDIVSDMMLVTKEDGNIVSCQPGTVRELVEFKQKYPNAQAIIVKTSESN